MKKILVLILVLTMLLMFSACDGNENTAPTSGDTKLPIAENASDLPLYPTNTSESVYAKHSDIPEIIFSTTGAENGLSGTIYSFSGKMIGPHEKLDKSSFFVVETQYGNVLMMNVYYDIKDYMSVDKASYTPPEIGTYARFTCIYDGFSGTAEMPCFTYGNDAFLLNSYGTNGDTVDGLEGSDIPKDWVVPDLSKNATVHELSYLAPCNWRSAEATYPEGWYYYPYEENTDGILYVCCSEKQLIGLHEMQDSIKTQTVLLSILKGLLGESEAYNDSFITVSGYPALVAFYRGELVDGVEYEHKVCIILTPEKTYAVLAAEPGVLASCFEACMDELVASISLPILSPVEVEENNNVVEEDREIAEKASDTPAVFEGNGEKVITDVNLQDGRYKVHILYYGDGVFAVFGYDADDDLVLVESSYGACEKYEVLRQAKFPLILEVTADAAWKIEFERID